MFDMFQTTFIKSGLIKISGFPKIEEGGGRIRAYIVHMPL